MAGEVTVPRLGWSMEEGTFGGWLKADGDSVREGDELFLLESDKATEAITALDSGVLHILPGGPDKGVVVTVGQVLAHVLAPGAPLPSVLATPMRTVPSAQGTPPPAEVSIPGQRDRSGRATPRARRTARALNITLADLTGTGRGGRIRERDVRAASGGRRVPLTPQRRALAARLSDGVHRAAPVTLTTTVDATVLRLRFESQRNISLTARLAYLTTQALKHHPTLNALFTGESLESSPDIHLALAVDTDAGLMAPVLRQAQTLSLEALAEALNGLVERAYKGRLRAEEAQGGTFTLSNLGMFGIDAFTPILNVPQVAILGIGRFRQEPAVVDGQIAIRTRMTLSLTFDHRVIDGAPAARFLDELRRRIEQD